MQRYIAKLFIFEFMKHLHILSLLTALVLTACDHKPPALPDCLTASSGFTPEDCPGNGSCSFEFYPDSKLVVNDEEQYISFEVKPGDHLVFHFKYKRQDNPLIMDDEYEEAIYFEVRPSGNCFLISSENLENAEALFGRMCFCPDEWYHRIDQGCIYGYKINEKTWNVSMNVTATSEFSSYNRMKQHDFTRQVRPD